MEQLNSFIEAVKAKYDRQGQAGKALIPSLGLLLFCCLCSLALSLFTARIRNAPGITPGPIILTSVGTQPTPTALFGFDFTPFPTLVAPSPQPTTPNPATATSPPTQTATQTATAVAAALSPTDTNTPASSSDSIRILTVNKPDEYVDIQNAGSSPVDLSGWRLVSVTGNQPCTLSGVLQPNEVLRVWAHAGTGGLSCSYAFNIWNDDRADPAVLYDPQGKEISRYP